ncbi:ProP Permease of the major facilitator superfamily [Pyrenophora tritici-repentis]|uniref:Major Facilitator Superprotein n=1 Tax=Pyrenophora tritici-repentis TaxID=45151 RepID=A0A2W1D228_9PLEO|nr:ProP Permease major facilitator superfamily [Pyrenophora tritici-repentis]KAF7444565.1 ProP Permease major facilitator superfamily [Pyrenophora tritici-repentis]KAF7564775.1 ProP, Permease major facilitator superfamily [Pyrenophora tritici-repentis]KAI0574282.1 ProP Permease major facilitator superfamily [Pyrenophora tritici-repentis]KAI0584998.1 ProP Permease major facilitator superfamily [Pyrenophora tritici-repentis]
MGLRFRSLRDLDQTDGTVVLQQTGSDETAPPSIILSPQPSPSDPNDPLRWPRWKKHVAFASVCAFTFLTNFGIAGLSPAFYILSGEFSKPINQMSHMLVYPILVLRVFNFFWVPMANFFGKRPIFVFASGLLCVSSVCGAVATSFQSLLWSNIIAAFAGSSTEALGLATVNDLYFLHERGGKMGFYMNAIAGGNTIGPLVCGFIVTNLSWRWQKWITVILTAINFIAIILFVPETRYKREEVDGVDDASYPSNERIVLTQEKASQDIIGHGNVQQLPKKTWAQDLSLWSGTSETNIAKIFIRPFPMIVYPAVIYAFLCYSISLVITVAVNILNPFVLQAPPYNWSPQINGLINIPGILGNVFGSWAGGNLVDAWCKWRTTRYLGVYEPESRIYMVAIPLVITTSGSILFGYGVQDALSWVSLFFGYGMISVALTAIPTVTLAYLSDCALPVNSDVLLLVNGLKNIVAFGFLYGVIPWVDSVGYTSSFGTLAGIFAGIVGVGAVFLIMYGATVRHVSAQWKVILE